MRTSTRLRKEATSPVVVTALKLAVGGGPARLASLSSPSPPPSEVKDDSTHELNDDSPLAADDSQSGSPLHVEHEATDAVEVIEAER